MAMSTKHMIDFMILFVRWGASSCAMDSLYDIDLISQTVPVILDDSKTWYNVLLKSMKLGKQEVANVYKINRTVLSDDSMYSNIFLINRTANPLSWYASSNV